jgi:hypothetical protein
MPKFRPYIAPRYAADRILWLLWDVIWECVCRTLCLMGWHVISSSVYQSENGGEYQKIREVCMTCDWSEDIREKG